MKSLLVATFILFGASFEAQAKDFSEYSAVEDKILKYAERAASAPVAKPAKHRCYTKTGQSYSEGDHGYETCLSNELNLHVQGSSSQETYL